MGNYKVAYYQKDFVVTLDKVRANLCKILQD